MANTDWEFTKRLISNPVNWTGSIDQYIGGYSGSGSIDAPTGPIGDQLRIFRLQVWRASSNQVESIKLISDSLLSSSTYPQLTQVVSSSAYSIRTWARMDLISNPRSSDSSNSTTFATGIVFKTEDSSQNNYGVDDNNVDCGYRLMLTTDNLDGTNKTNRQLNLKLCGANWTTGGILCSSSLNGFDFSMGEWYRIRLDVYEKFDTQNVKRDDLYAYLYNTGSAEWEQVGYVGYQQNSTSYIKWKDEPSFTGGERAGLVSYIQTGGGSSTLPASVTVPDETNSFILNAYYDLVEVYAIPWDRNAP